MILVNDIYETSWGYDQTNIDFIKVVKVSPSGKTAICVKIGQKILEQTGFMSETVIADPENVVSQEFRMKVAEYQGKPELRGSYCFCNGHESKRFGYFSIWDGKGCNQSHYA